MNEIKCPFCGSSENVRIIYGLPSDNLLDICKKGEIRLGGCCIYKANDTHYCKNCKNDFVNGSKFPLLYKMISLEIFIKGNKHYSHYFSVKGKTEEKVFKYRKINNEILKNGKTNFNTIKRKTKVKVIDWNSYHFRELVDCLLDFKLEEICDCNCDYNNYSDMDWKITIKFLNSMILEKGFKYLYPAKWEQLIECLSKELGQEIK